MAGITNVGEAQLDYISMVMTRSHECVSIKLSGDISRYGKTVSANSSRSSA